MQGGLSTTTQHGPSAGLMAGQRHRRCQTIKTALANTAYSWLPTENKNCNLELHNSYLFRRGERRHRNEIKKRTPQQKAVSGMSDKRGKQKA